MNRRELDKFYTHPEIAKKCGEIYKKHVEGYVVEPSAGDGSFRPFVDLMLDLAPESDDIVQQDFFDFDTTKYPNYLGNPPFGKSSSLAIKFFNHAAKGLGTIGFVIPRTFRKNSIQNRLDLHFHLVEEWILPENSFLFGGNPYDVPCVFQVWKWSDIKRNKIILPTTHPDFSFVSPEESNFSLRRVGVEAGKVNDNKKFYSKASNYYIKGDVEKFKSLEDSFREVAKDVAGNPSLSASEMVKIYTDKYGPGNNLSNFFQE